MNGIASCVMRVASSSGDGRLLTHCTFHAAVRGMEMGMSWATSIKLARELRSGGARARCRHHSRVQTFRPHLTSFNDRHFFANAYIIAILGVSDETSFASFICSMHPFHRCNLDGEIYTRLSDSSVPANRLHRFFCRP